MNHPEIYNNAVGYLQDNPDADWYSVLNVLLYSMYVGTDEWVSDLTDEEKAYFLLFVYESENS